MKLSFAIATFAFLVSAGAAMTEVSNYECECGSLRQWQTCMRGASTLTTLCSCILQEELRVEYAKGFTDSFHVATIFPALDHSHRNLRDLKPKKQADGCPQTFCNPFLFDPNDFDSKFIDFEVKSKFFDPASDGQACRDFCPPGLEAQFLGDFGAGTSFCRCSSKCIDVRDIGNVLTESDQVLTFYPRINKSCDDFDITVIPPLPPVP